MLRLLSLLAALLISCADPRVSLAREAIAATNSISESRVRVIIIVRDDCPKCDEQLKQLRRPGGPFEALRAKGWTIGETSDSHIQVVNRHDVPELVASLNDVDYPAIAATDGHEVLRYFKTGCTTPLDQWTLGWMMSGKNDRPTEPVPEPVQVASTGHYRLRGNHWSVEGDFNPSRGKSSLISTVRTMHHQLRRMARSIHGRSRSCDLYTTICTSEKADFPVAWELRETPVLAVAPADRRI